MSIEKELITIVTNTDNICPYCGKVVDPRGTDTEYVVNGKGKFKRKQYFHHGCFERKVLKRES